MRHLGDRLALAAFNRAARKSVIDQSLFFIPRGGWHKRRFIRRAALEPGFGFAAAEMSRRIDSILSDGGDHGADNCGGRLVRTAPPFGRQAESDSFGCFVENIQVRET